MTARSSAKNVEFSLTRKQRSQLSKLLKEGKPSGMQHNAIGRLERLATKFSEDIRRLGFPSVRRGPGSGIKP